MRIIAGIAIMFGLFLVAIVGVAARISNCKPVDDWCSRQLTDSQAEEDAK